MSHSGVGHSTYSVTLLTLLNTRAGSHPNQTLFFNMWSLIQVSSVDFFIGTESKMKLWDVLATCLLLLSSVATRPLYQNTRPAKRTYFPGSSSDSVSLSSEEDEDATFQREEHSLQKLSMVDQCKHYLSIFTVLFSWYLTS